MSTSVGAKNETHSSGDGHKDWGKWQQDTGSPPHPNPWRPFAVVLAASILNLLDTSVTNIAAPTIERDIGGGAVLIQWLGSAYTLALAAGLLVGGRLGDLYGRRAVFCVGMFGFTIASLACGLAQSSEFLIGARVVQGLSAALVLPQGLGVIRGVFPMDRLGKAFGIYGPAMGLAALLGPVLAGGIISANLLDLDWRPVFLINVPVGIILIITALIFLPSGKQSDVKRIDFRGAGLASSAAVLLVFPLVQGREHNWPWWTWACLALSVILFSAFARLQVALDRAGKDTLVVPSLFTSRVFSGGLVLASTVFSTMVGTSLVLAVYLQRGLGLSPILAAAVILPQPLGTLAGFITSDSKWLERIGRESLRVGIGGMFAGIVVILTELVLMDLTRTTVWLLAPGLLLYGMGMGIFLSKFFVTVLSRVEPGEYGSASGALNSVQQFAASIGVAVLGTVFFSALANTDMNTSLIRALIVTAIALVIAAAVVSLVPHQNRPTSNSATKKES